MGEGEAGPKTEGEEGEAGREGGSRGPIGTDEANAAMDAEKGAPRPITSDSCMGKDIPRLRLRNSVGNLSFEVK